MMNLKTARLLVMLMATVNLPALAQNVAVVNGKAIPTARVDAMVKQMVQQGQQDTPETRTMIKNELIKLQLDLKMKEAKTNASKGAGVTPQMPIQATIPPPTKSASKETAPAPKTNAPVSKPTPAVPAPAPQKR